MSEITRLLGVRLDFSVRTDHLSLESRSDASSDIASDTSSDLYYSDNDGGDDQVKATDRINSCYKKSKSHSTIQTYSNTYKGKEFEHYYISDGRNEAAERFLDKLNEHNARSDNATLYSTEINGKKGLDLKGTAVNTTYGGTRNTNGRVDGKDDFLNIRQMANMNAGFCMSNDPTNVWHWKPAENSYKEIETFKTSEIEKNDEDFKQILVRIRDRYDELKKKPEWVGWYYLFRLALLRKDAAAMYTLKDAEGREAKVPLILHMPELTIQHKTANGTKEPLRLRESVKDQHGVIKTPGFDAYANNSKIMTSNYCPDCLNRGSTKRNDPAKALVGLLEESYHYDVERLEDPKKFNDEWWQPRYIPLREQCKCLRVVYGI